MRSGAGNSDAFLRAFTPDHPQVPIILDVIAHAEEHFEDVNADRDVIAYNVVPKNADHDVIAFNLVPKRNSFPFPSPTIPLSCQKLRVEIIECRVTTHDAEVTTRHTLKIRSFLWTRTATPEPERDARTTT